MRDYKPCARCGQPAVRMFEFARIFYWCWPCNIETDIHPSDWGRP